MLNVENPGSGSHSSFGSALSIGSTLSIHHSTLTQFASRVLAAVRRIPPGRVATYGDVAAAAGRPRAARAVGNIMRDCTRHDVPCHRVVAAAGKLGGYGGNLEMKRALLRAEGIQVGGSTIREFRAKRFTYSRT
jgi:methylated-DNA-[protein]-cysteine S-methyltransferase